MSRVRCSTSIRCTTYLSLSITAVCMVNWLRTLLISVMLSRSPLAPCMEHMPTAIRGETPTGLV